MTSGELDFQPPIGGVYLSDVLQKRMQAIRVAVERGTRKVLESRSDESAYISAIISEYSVSIPHLDLEPEHIKKTEKYDQFHGSQLAGQVVIPDRMYRVWIVTFGIPYTGDVELIQYVPRTGGDFGWRPEIAVRDRHLWFNAQTLDGEQEQKKQAIRQEKERTLTFLQKCINAITPEIEEFNQSLTRDVPGLFGRYKQKYQQDQATLDEL